MWDNRWPTFITHARLEHFYVLLVHARGLAQFTLVVVGFAVRATHGLEGLTLTPRALTLILNTAGTPAAHSAATGLC